MVLLSAQMIDTDVNRLAENLAWNTLSLLPHQTSYKEFWWKNSPQAWQPSIIVIQWHGTAHVNKAVNMLKGQGEASRLPQVFGRSLKNYSSQREEGRLCPRLWHVWSPTIGPQLIGPSEPILSTWTNSPQKFGLHGQMVLRNLVPMDKWSPTNLVPIFLDPHSLSPWTNRIF